MQTKKIILVTGATGAQGGSVVKALLNENKFAVRVLTRNPQSSNAKSLQASGAELVQGDMQDLDSLHKALKGVYGVFGVTSFWEHFEKEYQHGRNLIDAVYKAGIGHFVFSSLENYFKASKGQLRVPHYDLKASLKEYTKQLGIRASFVQLGYYYENFFAWFTPRKAGDGIYYFGYPQGETKLAAVSVTDLGPVVTKIFDHPNEYIGRTVDIVGADLTGHQYAEILSNVLDVDIRYKYIPRDEYAKAGFDGAEELANMFEVQRLYYQDHQLGLIESYGLNPGMQSFESWARANKQKFREVLGLALAEAV